ncbi:LytR/AlgR family response regulator transcription factor [Jeotgalibaca porci]|uniref:LytR/AlgR family response regulator transcription factor n=3 Tax=Jeotgalibaca porci TaxID=1868793 RepID=UPI00359F6121
MRMYRVAICENELVQAQFLQKILEEYAQKQEIRFKSEVFESAEVFLFQYAEEKAVDLILLDIQMAEMDGLTMAEKLRAVQDQVKIIFITGLTEHIGDGYRVAASDYLIKPIKKEQLFNVLDRVLKTLPDAIPTIILPTADEQVKITIDSIICAEIVDRELTITTTSGTYKTRLTMKQLNKELNDPAFIVPDRSWLIHCGHIERVRKTAVIMDNGMSIPVSRRNQKTVMQAFIDFHRR